MKKYIMIVLSCIFLFVAADVLFLRMGVYVDTRPNAETTTFVKTKGKEIALDQGSGFAPFEIRGVDLGVGIPGEFATGYAIDKETYLRWFQMIQEMGANTIRIYTILQDDFYQAVYEYNEGNPNPLYVLHGLWVNDYTLNSHVDAYDKSFLEQMKKDSRTMIDVIHGRQKLNLGYGTGSGVYDKDISPWVIGYILGVEWDPGTVAYTDHMQQDKNFYQGEYLYTTEDATPFEAMLAQVGDYAIGYETGKYKVQKLMAFSNWPTTDPLEYPGIIPRILDKWSCVDVEHIRSTEHFLSGQFASYHIYPYFPDYLNYYESWKEEVDLSKVTEEDGSLNTYRAYLTMVNQHHTMPVVISEFGVPSSRGMAQKDKNTGRNQGKLSEKEQGEALKKCYEDIMEAGCAGSAVFSWSDEWFKRTWNTMNYTDLNKTPYWSDFQSNEQFFGLLTFDPGEKESVCYVDGDVSEWKPSDVLWDGGDGLSLSMKYDEKFLYFMIHKDGGIRLEDEKIYLPLDITPKSGSTYMEGENVKFGREADFVVVLNGRADSRILVQDRYDVFKVMFSEQAYRIIPYLEVPSLHTPKFNRIFLMLMETSGDAYYEDGTRRKNYRHMSKEGETYYETGKLLYGNANPEAEDFNSIADFIVDGESLELRIPWLLLNFSNPSERQIHDDYYEHYGIENLTIESIYAGVGTKETSGRIPMEEFKLEGWGRNPTYHERLKDSYYAMQQIWAGK
ncbi:MAG: hypothetical protein ACOYBE_04400 [Blautia sp.]